MPATLALGLLSSPLIIALLALVTLLFWSPSLVIYMVYDLIPAYRTLSGDRGFRDYLWSGIGWKVTAAAIFTFAFIFAGERNLNAAINAIGMHGIPLVLAGPLVEPLLFVGKRRKPGFVLFLLFQGAYVGVFLAGILFAGQSV